MDFNEFMEFLLKYATEYGEPGLCDSDNEWRMKNGKI
jgi:hypothetical protein